MKIICSNCGECYKVMQGVSSVTGADNIHSHIEIEGKCERCGELESIKIMRSMEVVE